MKTPLSITHVPIDSLNPAVYNPRKWGEEEKKKLTESIKRFGMVDPPITNSGSYPQSIVVSGYFLLEIAKEPALTETPVVRILQPEETGSKSCLNQLSLFDVQSH